MNFSIKTFTTESGTSPCLAFTTDKLKIVSSKEWRDGQGLVCVCVSHMLQQGFLRGHVSTEFLDVSHHVTSHQTYIKRSQAKE